MSKKNTNAQKRVHLRAKGRMERTMKKQCMRCLAAVSLIVTMGTGAGTDLKANDKETTGKSGGGVFPELKS